MRANVKSNSAKSKVQSRILNFSGENVMTVQRMRRNGLSRCFRAVLQVIVAGLCSTLFAQSPSTSKLSAHLINAYTVGSSNIVSGRPRILKVLGLDSGFPSGMVQAMRDYKTKVPSGKIIVRVY